MSITILDRGDEFFVYLNNEEWKFNKSGEMIAVISFISGYAIHPFSFKTTLHIQSDLSQIFTVLFDNKKFIVRNKKELYNLIKIIIQYKEKYGRWKRNAD